MVFSVNLVDHKSQLEEDEQLARAIEESLNLESPPKHGNDNNNNNMYQPIQYFPMGYRYELDNNIVHHNSHLFVPVLLNYLLIIDLIIIKNILCRKGLM
jgi:hypothetical protein